MGTLKFLVACVALSALGSRMSQINPEACDRGSWACGTAWFLLLLIAIAVVGLVNAAFYFGVRPPRDTPPDTK